MPDYFNSEKDDNDRLLPYHHRPGTDVISKLILTDKQVINVLSNVLVPEAAEDSYFPASTEFITGKKCDVLYAPRDPLSSFLPILIEIQNQVDDKFLTRAIHYCTLIYNRYNKLPIIVVFGIANVTLSLQSKAVDSEFPFARQLPNLGWAERCLLLTSSTLQMNQEENTLHPLRAIGYFLCSQSLSISTLEYGRNDSLEMKRQKKKSLSYVEATLEFLQRQKRKYCEAIETTPIEETPPLVYLNKRRQLSTVELENEVDNAELYDFVQRFKKTTRINWKECFKTGQLENIKSIKQFNTIHHYIT
ncbi:hypothetical protein G6F43_011634 [Rhizopus delemar]|nr:hypothetical protein G6F43_011634 [Rhizopus delemar]